MSLSTNNPDADAKQMAVYAVVRLVGTAESVVGVSLVAELLLQARCAMMCRIGGLWARLDYSAECSTQAEDPFERLRAFMLPGGGGIRVPA